MGMHTQEDKNKIYSCSFVSLRSHFNNIMNLGANIKMQGYW